MKMQDNSSGWPEGWLAAAAAGVFAAVMVRVVGDLGLLATLVIGVFVFLVFGVLLGMFWGSAPSSYSGGNGGHGDGHDHGHDLGHSHAPGTTAAAAEPAAPAPVAQAVVAAPEVVVTSPVVVEAVDTPDPEAAVEATPAQAFLSDPTPVADASAPEPVAAPAKETATAPGGLMSADSADAGVGSKPVGLSGPRNGVGDKLQTIEGIGPVLEKLCHELGIYHFDQIAGWGAAETAWMDGNLKGFKGRVTRDKWVRQAKLIGEVGVEAFLIRAKTNDY
ncbi:MAG: hypothetical protein ACRC14_17035 [Paracoccaceae bacterium]